LWKKADTANFKADFKRYSEEFSQKHQHSNDIDLLWHDFNTKSQELFDKHVPSKMTTQRYSQPWINRKVKQLSAKKKRYFNKAKASGKQEDFDKYKQCKKECQQECRKAHNTYISDMLDEDCKNNPKKFYSYIKSKKCDANGVSPLNSNGTIQSDSKTKAEILNNQFVSVFTTEDANNIPYLNSKYKDVQHITVTRNGLLKLLKDINVHKATGPDNISGMMLKSGTHISDVSGLWQTA